jgi:hypothetical protein
MDEAPRSRSASTWALTVSVLEPAALATPVLHDLTRYLQLSLR